MATQANKALALRFLEEMSHRGAALFEDLSVVTDDFVWWAGSLGEYDRPQMAARMRQVGRLFAGPNRRTIRNVVAEGDLVVVEFEGDTPLKDGRRYQNKYLNLFFLRDGRVAMVKEYCDTAYAKEMLRPKA